MIFFALFIRAKLQINLIGHHAHLLILNCFFGLNKITIGLPPLQYFNPHSEQFFRPSGILSALQILLPTLKSHGLSQAIRL